MTINSQLSTTESKKTKNKLSKQLEQEQNHRYGDNVQGYQRKGKRGRKGGKVQGLRSINSMYKIDKGILSIGNEEAKERICMTHGHELREGG